MTHLDTGAVKHTKPCSVHQQLQELVPPLIITDKTNTQWQAGRTWPAKKPHTPMMQRMLKTAEPTMVPTPTSPLVMNTPEETLMHKTLNHCPLETRENTPATLMGHRYYITWRQWDSSLKPLLFKVSVLPCVHYKAPPPQLQPCSMDHSASVSTRETNS